MLFTSHREKLRTLENRDSYNLLDLHTHCGCDDPELAYRSLLNNLIHIWEALPSGLSSATENFSNIYVLEELCMSPFLYHTDCSRSYRQ